MLRPDACGKKDRLIGLPQIQLIFSSALFIQHPFQAKGKLPERLSGKKRPECLRHVPAHLIAVPADGRADPGQQILRAASESLFHGLRRPCPHPLRRSPPAGVGQSHGAPHGIHEQKRHAVRIKGGKGDARLIGDQPVHIPVILRAGHALPLIRRRHAPDIDRMRLIRADDILRPAPKKRRRPSEIFLHIFLPVSPGEAQIHAPKLPLADAAGARGHQMADQSGFTDCRKGQIFRAVLFIQPHARPDPRFPFQTVHGFPPLRLLLPHGSSSHIVKSILIPVHPLSADSDHIEPYRNALSQMLSI